MRVKHSTLAPIFSYGLLPTVSAILLTSISLAEERSSAWPQWGGPNRNFKVASPALADSWPPDGPPKIWSRSLGDGYSAIVADQGVLYTMYHRSASDGSPQEAVIAVDADSGKTKWEYRYDTPFPSELMTDYGPGPNATPLIVGSRLFTVGSTAKLQAFDTETWGRFVSETEFRTRSAVTRGSHLPDVAHLANDIHFVDRLGGPAHHAYPILKVGLLHRLALGNQFAILEGAVDL